MKVLIDELLRYFKNPVLEKDENKEILYRLKTFFNLLVLSFITTFSISFINGFLEISGLLETGKHSIEEAMKNLSGMKFFLFAAVVAPIIEECIFRAPITLFKKPTHFKIAFYTLTLMFGYMHIANFEITLTILLFSPLLVAQQIFIGLYLGFT